MRERLTGIARRQGPGDPGEAGSEAEGLDPSSCPGRGVSELHQLATVGRHRSRNVQDKDERACSGAATFPCPMERFALGPERSPDRGAEVEPRSLVCTAEPTRSLERDREGQPSDEGVDHASLCVGQLREVLPPKHLGLAGHDPQDGRLVGLLPGVAASSVAMLVPSDRSPLNLRRVHSAEVPVEQCVQRLEVLRPGHQGGARGESKVDGIERIERGGGPAEGHDPPRSDGEALGPEISPESDQPRQRRGGVRGCFSRSLRHPGARRR